jgi:hypothetical protein
MCVPPHRQHVSLRLFSTARTVLVDNSRSACVANFKNAIRVPDFEGDPADDCLPKLAAYLKFLSPVADVRVPLSKSFGITSVGKLFNNWSDCKLPAHL